MSGKRLIDANALAKRIAHLEIYEVIKHVDFKTSSVFEEVRYAMFELVLKRPTIDAVPVVRCRECKEYIYPAGVCKRWNRPVRCDGYCNWGAKMDAQDMDVPTKDGGASDGNQ